MSEKFIEFNALALERKPWCRKQYTKFVRLMETTKPFDDYRTTVLFTSLDQHDRRNTVYLVETRVDDVRNLLYVCKTTYEGPDVEGEKRPEPTFELFLKETEEQAKDVFDPDMRSFLIAVAKGEQDSHPLSRTQREKQRRECKGAH